MSNDARCGWCRHSVGTTSRAYVFCQQANMQVFRDSSLKCFEREPGSDDDLGDDSEE